MVFERWRVMKCEVGLVTLGGKGHADTGQHLPTALAKDPRSKTTKIEPDKRWYPNFQRVFFQGLRCFSSCDTCKTHWALQLCRSMRLSGLKVWSLTYRVGPTPGELSSWKLGQLPLDEAGLLLGALVICHPKHQTPVFFCLFLSLETTADKEGIQASPLSGFRLSTGTVAKCER